MLFHSFYLAIVRMHTKEKMICSFSCHSTSLMSLSTLVEIYTLLCHEAEGELIYDSRNFICIYTFRIVLPYQLVIYDSRNFICTYNSAKILVLCHSIYDSRNFICTYNKDEYIAILKRIYDSRNFICTYKVRLQNY